MPCIVFNEAAPGKRVSRHEWIAVTNKSSTYDKRADGLTPSARLSVILDSIGIVYYRARGRHASSSELAPASSERRRRQLATATHTRLSGGMPAQAASSGCAPVTTGTP